MSILPALDPSVNMEANLMGSIAARMPSGPTLPLLRPQQTPRPPVFAVRSSTARARG